MIRKRWGFWSRWLLIHVNIINMISLPYYNDRFVSGYMSKYNGVSVVLVTFVKLMITY